MSSPIAISVSTVAYDGYEFERACESLARLGATHVEPAFVAVFGGEAATADFSQASASALAASIARNGLACEAITVSLDLGALRAAPAMLERMEFARRAGARVVNVLAPPRRRERAFLVNLEAIARAASALGIRVGLENPGDGIASVIDAAADTASLVDRFGADGIGINYDLGNRATHAPDEDPVLDALRALPHCVNVHLKDIRRTPQGWFFTAIGQGEIDCGGLLDAIRARASPPPCRSNCRCDCTGVRMRRSRAPATARRWPTSRPRSTPRCDSFAHA